MIIKFAITIITLMLVLGFFLGMLQVTVAFASENTEEAIDGLVEEEQKETIIEMIEKINFFNSNS